MSRANARAEKLKADHSLERLYNIQDGAYSSDTEEMKYNLMSRRTFIEGTNGWNFFVTVCFIWLLQKLLRIFFSYTYNDQIHYQSWQGAASTASSPKTMLVLSCPYKLRMLERMLRKSLPQAIVVHGAVMNINRGNPIGHEVIVDSWPEFKVVLTRPRKEVITDPSDAYANVYAAFYQDLDKYRRLLKDTDAVNWDHTFHLFGTQEGIPEATQDAASAKQTQLSVIPHFLYVLSDPNKLHHGRLEPGFRLTSLNSSNVDLLNENWAYGRNEQSHRYLAKMIQHFPSTGILNQEGHLISWMLMDLFGTQSHAYTLPSFRGKGYLAITTKALCMQAHIAGYPLYGFVVLKNNQMQSALEKGGYDKVSELSYLCFHYTT